ncbi:hypothetical protein [Amycolatopsis palatopharyngis]|uniref:hypothetical protein n=1 Tax=Amycolatopsis palatopharyngis TaxID=187982 RepID=UPI0013BE991B|nr:hypothetical protein [Amycolatopsis palatopharyngis]
MTVRQPIASTTAVVAVLTLGACRAEPVIPVDEQTTHTTTAVAPTPPPNTQGGN